MDLSNKNNRIIFFFITWIGGPFGIHWFIQKNYIKGILYLFSFGGFIVCWIYDWFISLKNIFSYDPNKFPIQSNEKYIKKNKLYNQNNNDSYTQYNKEIAIQSFQMQVDNFNRILTDVQCGFKNLNPYLSRYRILLEIYNELENLNTKYSLDALSYDSKMLYDTFNAELLKFIKNKIIITLDKHSIDNDGNKALIKDLKKIRDNVIEGKHEYPEFSELLQEIQFQIEKQLNQF